MPIETRDRRLFAAELKFLLPPDVAEAVRQWARTEMTADPHGGGSHGDEYAITTLYTDTPGQDVFRRRASYGRAKYRARRYGDSDVIFLERKLRTKSLLSKRRSIVQPVELAWLDHPTTTPVDWHGEWFVTRVATRQLSPVCQVSYHRTARVTPTPYGLARLTVDRGLCAQAATRWTFESPNYAPVLTDRHILELKFLVAMPAMFKRLLEAFQLAPESVSKYRLSMSALGLGQTEPSTEVA